MIKVTITGMDAYMVTETSIDLAAKADGKSAISARTRRTRLDPVPSFEKALSLGEAAP